MNVYVCAPPVCLLLADVKKNDGFPWSKMRESYDSLFCLPAIW